MADAGLAIKAVSTSADPIVTLIASPERFMAAP
jgi:hypothetical protein